MSTDKTIEKLNSLFKEEVWGRIEPKKIGISKFKILDDIFNVVVSENNIEQTLELCRKHQEEYPSSITASYLIGLIGYHADYVSETVQLRKLIDVFMKNGKWAVVEKIAEKILEYGESETALHALATSLERLGKSKEAIPVWENSLKINRFDAEVAKKLAFAIIDEEPEKSIHYMKLSIEGFIKLKKHEEVTSLWNKLVSISWNDINFFNRIERMLVDLKQLDMVSNLLKTLLVKHKEEGNVDILIELLKKILLYRPQDLSSRKDLIKAYKKKYGEHSQFDQFLKLSALTNFKIPVRFAIEDFEKNIVFDIDNYVYHNSWGLGKILKLDNESLIIEFKDKPEHKMSIKMALQSLSPISDDHLYVLEKDDSAMIKNLFEEDFIQFFEILIKSYGGEITLNDIKKEIISRFVEEKNWAKWWNKNRSKIKKDPLYGFSPKNKNLIFIRDNPVTFSDELLNNFIKQNSFSEKLKIAFEFINNIDEEEGSGVGSYFIDYFSGEIKGTSATKKLLSYFILKDLDKYATGQGLKIEEVRSKIVEFIKESDDLSLVSVKINSYDYKKELVNLIEEARDDWPQILSEILFETPVRIHKYIINSLIRKHAYNIINDFIDKSIMSAREHPEIFIWVAKNILSKNWNYDWLDFSKQNLVINYFRLMNELKKFEGEGKRFKNMMLDLLFENDNFILKEIIQEFDQTFIGKVYDIFTHVSYISEEESDKFLDLIKEKNPDFFLKEKQEDVDLSRDKEVEKFIVTQEGFEKKQKELDWLVNVQMIKISKDLAKISGSSADPLQNAEYNSLQEKQVILEQSISKLDEEMKKADILNLNDISTEKVNIGTKILIEEITGGERETYTILGPWDADFEKGILSYRSPLAKFLLGVKLNEECQIRIDDQIKKYKILSIEKYKS